MFWHFDKKFNTIKNFEFYQIFNNFKSETIDNNDVYNFLINKKNYKNYLSSYKSIEAIYEIKIIDNLIYYKNIESNEILTFSINNEFINENNNSLNLPIIKYNYSSIESSKIPYMNTNLYNYYYEKIIFKIYHINDDILFIEERKDNIIKNYILCKNLENNKILISNILI